MNHLDLLLPRFPQRRLHPVDGMAVTAEVWEEAHRYHRLFDQLLLLISKGAGIVSGLEVLASDPADRTVYITPGVAVDAEGQLIIIHEAIAYNIGARAAGPYRLLVRYAESRSAPPPPDSDEPLYVQHQFGLEAHPLTATAGGLELARFTLSNNGGPITNTTTALAQTDEIDLRFRATADRAVAPLSVGLLVLGASSAERPLAGWQSLNDFLEYHRRRPVYPTELKLSDDFDPYDLLAITAAQAVTLSSRELERIYDYWKAGGRLWFDLTQRGEQAPAARVSLENILTTFGFRLSPVTRDHALLQKPHRFAEAPPGYVKQGEGIWVGERVLYTPLDYNSLWQGDQSDEPPTRGAIRAAHEIGDNILAFLMENSSS